MTNDLPAGTEVGATTFQAAYTLNGNALTLFGNLSANDSTTINVDLRLGASLTLAAFTGYYGAIDVNGQTLTLPSGYNVVTRGPVNGSGFIAGALYAAADGNFSGAIVGWLDLNRAAMPNANVAGSLTGEGTVGNVTLACDQCELIPRNNHSFDTPAVLHTKSVNISGNALVGLSFAGTGFDTLQVTGSVNLSGGVLAVGTPPGPPGQSYTIIDNDGSDPVVGTFSNAREGAVLYGQLRITYHGGDGNDVVVTLVTGTTTTLGQSSASSASGASVTFTATVGSNSTTPTGSVTFYDGNTLLGTAPLQNGLAAFSTSSLGGGTHSITAHYDGEGMFGPSVSQPVAHTVQGGQATVTAGVSPQAPIYGTNVILTAAVSPALPGSVPTGGVTFSIDGAVIGSATLLNGTATFTTSALSAGAHVLAAAYAGDSNYSGVSSAPQPFSIGSAPTLLDARSLRNPSPAGDRVTLEVTVSAAGILQPVIGSVIVTDKGAALAQSPYSGTPLRVDVSGLSSGEHQLGVTFNGANFAGSTTTIAQTVLPPALFVDDISSTEGDAGTKIVSLPVKLSVASQQTVTVEYSTEDGTAMAGEDYLPIHGTLTFAPGETGKYVDVTIVGDTKFEPDETFEVVLSNPTNATLEGGPATVTIVNDDASYRKSTFAFATIGSTQLMLDVDTPLSGNGPFPAIVWVGGTTSYAPGGDSPALRETARGYVVVIPAYRAAGQALFPAQLDDLQTAIRWIRANAAALHVDAGHIGIWGGGAGGHLAALAGTTADRATATSLAEGNASMSNRVQAVVDWAGPADLRLLQSDAAAIASCVPSYDDPTSPQSLLIGCALPSCTDAANAASPQSFVSADDAPILIMHGANDCVVPPEQSQRFYDALVAARVDATLRIIDGLGAFGSSWDANVPWSVVDAFLDAHLRGISSRRRAAGH